MKRFVWLLLLSFSLGGCTAVNRVADVMVDTSYSLADDKAQISPIREFVYEVNSRFSDAGINGKVVLDSKGRLTLKGKYENEDEVDRAFAIAQTMVGVQWVSPVTPSNIRVNSWAKCLAQRALATHISEECKFKLDYNQGFVSDGKAPANRILNKYALVVGISHFKTGSVNLEYADKDAQAVYDYLIDPKGGNISENNVTLLTNEQATRSAIETELQNIKAKAKKDDLVLVYFSSHGTIPDKTGNTRIVVYDSILPVKKKGKTEKEQVEEKIDAWKSSLKQETLMKDFARALESKRLAVILDTCYSGGVFSNFDNDSASDDKQLLQGLYARLNQLKKADSEYSTGQSVKVLQENLLGAKDIFVEDEALNYGSRKGKSLNKTGMSFSHAGDWGVILMSASSENERSWEPSEKQKVNNGINNGIFTHFFLQALRNTNGNIKKAFSIAKPQTASCAKERGLYKGKPITQTPQLFPYRANANIILGN